MKLYEIHEQIAAVCPIEGINSDGVICYGDEAGELERLSAQEKMAELLPLLEVGV